MNASVCAPSPAGHKGPVHFELEDAPNGAHPTGTTTHAAEDLNAPYQPLAVDDPRFPAMKRHVLVLEVFSHEHQDAMLHMCATHAKAFEANGTICGSEPDTMPALDQTVRVGVPAVSVCMLAHSQGMYCVV